MPSSAVLRFNDPDEYQAYVEGLGIRLKTTVMTPGAYVMELTTTKFEELLVTRGRISLPHIVRSGWPSLLTVLLNTPGLVNGKERSADSITVAPAGVDAFYRSPTKVDWSGLSIAPEKLAAAAQALLGYDLAIPASVRITDPPLHLVRRLRNLHEAACRLAETVPDVLAHPEVGRAIEQELIGAMVSCMGAGEAIDRNRIVDPRAVRRFEDALAADPDRPFYLTEVCARMGVSERTLRKHCLEHLGVSPHRYLWLRRMNLARWTLARADPRTTSVTEIAMDCGFGELGRFAVAYKRLFGESPSTTLAGGTCNFTSSPSSIFNRSGSAFA